mmetsp:Transcript_36311/g.71439  ORF Transcript_36311/g.71439 Transcript_36311/m.71439 type:complete len:136 (-) Transcript_36311:174-581(-)
MDPRESDGQTEPWKEDGRSSKHTTSQSNEVRPRPKVLISVKQAIKEKGEDKEGVTPLVRGLLCLFFKEFSEDSCKLEPGEDRRGAEKKFWEGDKIAACWSECIGKEWPSANSRGGGLLPSNSFLLPSSTTHTQHV